jgi:hypothetical protein
MGRRAECGMSREEDLHALTVLFQEACSLNREALTLLRGQTPPAAMRELFERKSRLAQDLARAQKTLSQASGVGENLPGLERALEVQQEAAALEAQVAEALGNAVPRVGKVIEAYVKSSEKPRPDKRNYSS